MDDDERIRDIRELSESYSGLQYVAFDPTKQWPWGSTLAVNEIVDLVRAVPELLARADALTAERDALRARAERAEAALRDILREAAWESHLTEWRKHSVTAVGTQPTPHDACREIRAIARAALAASEVQEG